MAVVTRVLASTVLVAGLTWGAAGRDWRLDRFLSNWHRLTAAGDADALRPDAETPAADPTAGMGVIVLLGIAVTAGVGACGRHRR